MVLDGIRVSWEWLCAAPHPVTVAGGEIAGLPDRRIGLGSCVAGCSTRPAAARCGMRRGGI